METLHFENESLPIYCKNESIAEQTVHSSMAHWHENIELISVAEGSLLCCTAGKEFQLSAGDVCFINRRQLHQIYAADSENAAHTALIVGTGLLSQNGFMYEKYIRHILEDSDFSHVRFASGTSSAVNISIAMEHLEKILREKEFGYEFEAISAVYKIFKQLYLAYRGGSAKVHSDSNAAVQQKMTEYIYLNYAEALTLDRIADAGCVSRSQCTKLFRQYAQLSPIAFLNRHRLEVSRDLIRGGQESILDIALRCGFTDQSYFNRLFLREYGCTPLNYRKKTHAVSFS